MATDCYEVSRNCITCARERIKLRKDLASVSLDLLRPLLKTKRGNLFLMVNIDRFTKLTVAVSMQSITAWDLALALNTHWEFLYRLPSSILTANSTQMSSKFFTHICQILSINNLLTKTYHLKTNEQR